MSETKVRNCVPVGHATDDITNMARTIHYPECWDTMVYPTLVHALWELAEIKECTSTECVHKHDDGMGVSE